MKVAEGRRIADELRERGREFERWVGRLRAHWLWPAVERLDVGAAVAWLADAAAYRRLWAVFGDDPIEQAVRLARQEAAAGRPAISRAWNAYAVALCDRGST